MAVVGLMVALLLDCARTVTGGPLTVKAIEPAEAKPRCHRHLWLP